MANEDVKLRLGVDGASLDSSLSKAGSRIQKWGKKVAGNLDKALRGAFTGLSAVAGFSGVGALAILGRDFLEAERSITRFRQSASLTAGDTAALRMELDRVSLSTGISRGEVLAGAQAFQALTGNTAETKAQMGLFAKVAAATGAPIRDIANTAGAAANTLGIAGGQMEAFFNTVLVQGKAGAVELTEQASILAGLAAQAATFGKGKGLEGVERLGAALQIVRRGFGSSREAATGLQALMTGLNQNARKLQKVGVKVFEKDGKTFRSLEDIVFDIQRIAGNNPQLLQKLLPRQEALEALRPLLQSSRAEYEKLMVAGRGQNEIEKDLKIQTESLGGQLDILKAKLGAAFSETATRNMGSVTRGFRLFADGLEFIAKNLDTLLKVGGAAAIGGLVSKLASIAGLAGPFGIAAAAIALLVLNAEGLEKILDAIGEAAARALGKVAEALGVSTKPLTETENRQTFVKSRQDITTGEFSVFDTDTATVQERGIGTLADVVGRSAARNITGAVEGTAQMQRIGVQLTSTIPGLDLREVGDNNPRRRRR